MVVTVHHNSAKRCKYKIDGTLKGINGIELEVRTIWIVETNYDQARFVTLVPRG
ncbi:DUF6883 domain-containing protein [Roseofilum sp. SID1]|uniref:DUF6883 domain-containing protein n=1 Tax=unclassified Roseofilum TaxID=2620099 RepID=UPI0039A30FB2